MGQKKKKSPKRSGSRVDMREPVPRRDAIGVQNNYAPPEGAAAPVLGLPQVDPGFTSRDTELGRVLALLDPKGTDQAGLVVAEGMGGVGKTQLALVVGHKALAREWFAGALFIDLHGYTTPVDGDRAVESFLHALEVPTQRWPADADGKRALYRSALERRAEDLGGPILVVADNASHADQVRPLLPGQTRHRVLITSRDRLTSLHSRRIVLGHLDEAHSVSLLGESLRIVDPDDERADDTADLGRMAKACGGLPLALRICAAILSAAPDMSTGELATTLEDAESRLVHLRDDSRNLRAVFEQSRARLSKDAAEMLALLGLAPGPDISMTAASVLAGDTEQETLVSLRALASAHLVSGKKGRWRMHDLVADYAASLASGKNETGRYPRARRRLLQHYTAVARDARSHLDVLPGEEPSPAFRDRSAALKWFDTERAVLLDAVHTEVERGIGLPFALIPYLANQRSFHDMEVVSRIAIHACQKNKSPENEGMAWNGLGLAFRQVGRFEEAIEAHHRALGLLEQCGDPFSEGMAWNGLGLAFRKVGRFEEAIEAHHRAHSMHRQLGDTHREAIAWNNLGLALQEVGRFEEAIEAHHRAQGLLEQCGDTHREATVWNNLGTVLREVDRFEEATALLNRAVDYFASCRDEHSEGDARYELGLTWVAAGDPDRAVPYLERAVELLGANNDPHLHGKAARALAEARAALGGPVSTR
ncbi:ATP-binding protein [Nocardiopsis tropica]|uniref:Tetratricopeptide repeat protein n=1 Tax=Nocardiopsis tropica TaxID=109330 RepID=A0ABV1ZP67_9ACTN